jgi:hypothetical protein
MINNDVTGENQNYEKGDLLDRYNVLTTRINNVQREATVARAAYNNGQSGTRAVQIPETPVQLATRLTEVIKSGEAAETPLARVLKILPPHIVAQIDQKKVVADALSHKSPPLANQSIGGLPSQSIKTKLVRRAAPRKQGQPNAPTGAVG